jgi:hypothetical protein
VGRIRLLRVVALAALFGYSGAAMSADEDMPMFLRRATETETISADIAIRIAEMVFAHNYGRDVTDHQLPLTVRDGGDRWIVEGSNLVASSPDLTDPVGGKLRIAIMKVDGRIAELARELVPGP